MTYIQSRNIHSYHPIEKVKLVCKDGDITEESWETAYRISGVHSPRRKSLGVLLSSSIWAPGSGKLRVSPQKTGHWQVDSAATSESDRGTLGVTKFHLWQNIIITLETEVANAPNLLTMVLKGHVSRLHKYLSPNKKKIYCSVWKSKPYMCVHIQEPFGSDGWGSNSTDQDSVSRKAG